MFRRASSSGVWKFLDHATRTELPGHRSFVRVADNPDQGGWISRHERVSGSNLLPMQSQQVSDNAVARQLTDAKL